MWFSILESKFQQEIVSAKEKQNNKLLRLEFWQFVLNCLHCFYENDVTVMQIANQNNALVSSSFSFPQQKNLHHTEEEEIKMQDNTKHIA